MSDTDKAEHKNVAAKADTKEDTKTTAQDSKKDSAKDSTKPRAPTVAAKGPDKNNVSAAPKSSSPARARAWPGMFILMILSAVLGAGIATYWTSPAANTRLAQIETRFAELETASVSDENLRGDLNAVAENLAQVETRVENLENAPDTPGIPAAPGQPAAPGAVDPRIGQLSARLSAIENTVPADLAARMSELEQTNSGEILLRAGRTLALSDLSRAATGSEPFAIELQAAIATAPDEPMLDVFRAYAPQGVPVPAQLLARFPEAARQALAAERAGDAENIFARMWSGFAGLISIRRVGNVEGANTGARLARAEAALGRDDLAIAVAELRDLEGAAAQSMSTWLEDAEARLEIENAVDAVNALIVQTLGDQSTPANTP